MGGFPLYGSTDAASRYRWFSGGVFRFLLGRRFCPLMLCYVSSSMSGLVGNCLKTSCGTFPLCTSIISKVTAVSLSSAGYVVISMANFNHG
jgi:hypothetical protein